MTNSKFLLITILTVLLLGLNSWSSGLIIIREINSSIEENSKSTGNHAPINIDGNEALATFIEDEGLSGNGTFTSPYIIENFIINASTAHGIEIHSTDAYLMIQNCTVEGGGYSYDGIHLLNATNVNISNNDANNNDYGILLSSSSNNNTLSGNTANNNRYGIHLWGSSNNTLSGNTANNNDYGIRLWRSSNNNTLSGNTASYNNDFGIHLDSPINNNILSGNTANNNGDGIFLAESSNNILSGNTANNNKYGIGLWESSNNTLSGNTASNNDYGIRTNCSSNNILSGNNASYNNDFGIYLYYKSNNNTIYFNDIYENTKGQAFEDKDCTDNLWDNGKIGNYWGVAYINNYPSATNDGSIWNIPYEINGTGSGIDHFPLVNSITTYDTTDSTTPTITTTTWEVTTTTTTTTSEPALSSFPEFFTVLLCLGTIVVFAQRHKKE